MSAQFHKLLVLLPVDIAYTTPPTPPFLSVYNAVVTTILDPSPGSPGAVRPFIPEGQPGRNLILAGFIWAPIVSYMKPKNLILRRRLANVEAESHSSSSPKEHRRLKEERRGSVSSGPRIPSYIPFSPSPLNLPLICRQWRNTACSTPRLWAALEADLSGGPGLTFHILVQEWLRRSRTGLSFLRLTLPYNHYSDSSRVVTLPFADRWTNLVSFHGTYLAPHECVDLLSRAPRLVDCEFDLITNLPFPSPSSKCPALNLQHLHLNPRGLGVNRVVQILDSLALPTLRSLKIGGAFQDFTTPLFCSFMERVPRLQNFDISLYGARYYGSCPNTLDTVPSLTSLRLLAAPATLFDILLRLTESPAFLPHITKITFLALSYVHWTDSFKKIYVDAVTSRSARLLEFELLLPRLPDPKVPSTISACISKFKKKGMHIHVGPRA
ncbi:hypothetical protein B0H16DRAFT_1693629 [Mycena metata]|uniref:F-box domain-containing protein n=1 Tax=Mycena metata TaxID=1033252 RepID=A0AAD7N2E1_9AGAR|nr:hypothetical protein B0H16DRAFT_1693629 [Mycena metata]